MSQSEYEQQQVNLADLAPSAWFTQKEGSSIWVSGYRMLRVEKNELLSGIKVFDMGQVRAVLLYGRLKYPKPIELEVSNDSQLQFTIPDPYFAETNEGAHLLLV